MAHFAEIDKNGLVLRVLAVNDSDIIVDGVESEEAGQNYLANILGLGGIWLQTSWSNSIRKNYAGTDFTYNKELDAFIPPKPYPSWILNNETALWEAPKPQPEGIYTWNEDSQEWICKTCF